MTTDSRSINRALKQVLLLATIIGLCILIIVELKGFLNGVLGALALYIILRKPYFHLVNQRGWDKYLAGLTLIGTSSLIIMVPLTLLGALFKNQFELLLDNYPVIVSNIEHTLMLLEKKLRIHILSDDATQRIAADLAARLPDLLTSTAGTAAVLMFMFFVLFFTLIEADRFETEVRKLLPFKKSNNDLLISEMHRVTISNIVGIPLIAMIQGGTALISYLFVGSPNPIILAVLTGFASVIPVVGTSLVWGPLGLYLLIIGQYWEGTFIILYGGIVVTSIDNLARMLLQKRMANIHPLITIFGVIVGINIFGFIGLIFGPLLVSYLFLLIKIYKNEFH